MVGRKTEEVVWDMGQNEVPEGGCDKQEYAGDRSNGCGQSWAVGARSGAGSQSSLSSE